MKRLLIRPVLWFLLAGTACAKYITPWAPAGARQGGDKLLEECQYRLEKGEWILERQTGYDYDSQGSLVLASLYENKKGRPEVRKTWEFGYTPDQVWSQVLQKGDSALSSMEGPIIGEVQEYRRGNHEIVRITNEWRQSSLFGAYKRVVTLDAKGQETRRDNFVHEAGAWVSQSRVEIRRNSADQIVREDLLILKTGEVYSSIHEFDDQGRPTSITRTGESQERMSYDGGGNLLTQESRLWRNGTWVRVARDVHAYDARGGKIETQEERVTLGNGTDMPDWRSLRKYVFDRDTAGLMETRVEWYLNGSDWNPIRKSCFRKNRDQDTLEHIDSTWHEGAWKPQERSVFEYDAERRRTGWLVYHYGDQGWTLYSLQRHMPVYNRARQLVSARFERWHSGDGAANGESAYAYDGKGYQTSYQIRERMDSGEEWGYRVTHKYLHPEGTGIVPGKRERRGRAPKVVAGKIAGPEGRTYDLRGRSLGGLPKLGIQPAKRD